MVIGLGDTTIFSDYTNWLMMPFNALASAGVSSVIGGPLTLNDPTTYSNGVVDTTLNDLFAWTGNFGSTLLGNNNAPVMDANYAFSNATKIVPGVPIIDNRGNLSVPPVDLNSVLVSGGQNAANLQANSPTMGSSVDASFNNTGTPSVGSSLGLWILLGVSGFVLLEVIKKK